MATMKRKDVVPLAALAVLMIFCKFVGLNTSLLGGSSDQGLQESSYSTTREMAWSCPPHHVKKNYTRGHTPVVIFAKARTGSTLLSKMVARLQAGVSRQKLHVFSLGELFSPGHTVLSLRMTKSALEGICKGGQSPRINKLHADRLHNPAGLISFLSNLPSWSEHAFFAFKIFDSHIASALKRTPESFVRLVDNIKTKKQQPAPKYIVLWRRRFIESFVSHKVAQASGEWAKFDTSAVTVALNKTELELYVQGETEYYHTLRDAMQSSTSDWLVLEYDKNLKKEAAQQETVQQLVQFLGVDPGVVNITNVLQHVDLEKQATVPISEQVTNWQEVVDWGYGGEVDDWDDIFDDARMFKSRGT